RAPGGGARTPGALRPGPRDRRRGGRSWAPRAPGTRAGPGRRRAVPRVRDRGGEAAAAAPGVGGGAGEPEGRLGHLEHGGGGVRYPRARVRQSRPPGVGSAGRDRLPGAARRRARARGPDARARRRSGAGDPAGERGDPPDPGARAPVTKPRVRDLLERKGDPLQLEALTGDVGLDREIPTSEASSPGLVLAGYTKRFAAHRLHILGETEVTYLASLDATARRRALETLFQFDLPCIVISKGQDPPADLLELARAKGV